MTLSLEREKYSRCYRDPNYKMGQGRAREIAKDIALIPAGSTYLDVGCGRGESIRLAESFGIVATGLELVPYLCNESVVEGNIGELPFEDSSFEYVSCYDVVEHLPTEQVDEALSELFRVASKWVFITTNDKSSIHNVCGDNLHLTRKPRDWWEQKISPLCNSLESLVYPVNEWHFRASVRPS